MTILKSCRGRSRALFILITVDPQRVGLSMAAKVGHTKTLNTYRDVSKMSVCKICHSIYVMSEISIFTTICTGATRIQRRTMIIQAARPLGWTLFPYCCSSSAGSLDLPPRPSAPAAAAAMMMRCREDSRQTQQDIRCEITIRTSTLCLAGRYCKTGSHAPDLLAPDFLIPTDNLALLLTTHKNGHFSATSHAIPCMTLALPIDRPASGCHRCQPWLWEPCNSALSVQQTFPPASTPS